MLFICHESFIDRFKLLLYLFILQIFGPIFLVSGRHWRWWDVAISLVLIFPPSFSAAISCSDVTLVLGPTIYLSVYIYILSFCRLKQTGLQTMTVCIYCSSVCSAFHDFRALAHVSFPVAGMLSFSECKKRRKKTCILISESSIQKKSQKIIRIQIFRKDWYLCLKRT